MQPAIQTGYLVLADLSGFTSFMATTELDHAQGILNNLYGLMRQHLTPALNLAEIEGDALFLYVAGHRLARGETLLEVIERTYVAFRDKQRSMKRLATCPCRACDQIPQLDLKFVAHCGEYVLNSQTGKPKPMGSCVNLAHRLLKNGVADATGWHGYVLFTEQTLERMGVRPEGAHQRVESYDHFGEMPVVAFDLDARYRELTSERRFVLGPEQTHVTVEHRFAAPAPLVWEWLHDPHKRQHWMPGSAWHATDRPAGRTGVGAHNHCSNAGFSEEVLDWKPFDYYAVRYAKAPIRVAITAELRPDGDATDLCWRMSMEGTAPRFVRAAACRAFADWLMKVRQGFATIDRMLPAEAEPTVQA